MFENPYLKTITSLDDLASLSPWASSAIEIVRENMESDSAHDEQHLLRVARNAMWFGQDGGDPDVIVPAAILHDLVNLPKNHPDRSKASEMSACKALIELASRKRFKNDDHVRDFYNAIHAHSFSANIYPDSVSAKSVQDADRIDALGLIGIARMFSVSGALGRQLCHPTDPSAMFRTESQLDEQRYTIDHFYVKLVHLPETMKTELGRKVANAKVGVMLDFIANFTKEFHGEIVLRK